MSAHRLHEWTMGMMKVSRDCEHLEDMSLENWRENVHGKIMWNIPINLS